MDEHEERFIRRFLQQRFRDRFLAKGGIPRKELWHFGREFEERHVIELPHRLHFDEPLAAWISELDLPRWARLISARRELDLTDLDARDFVFHEATIHSFVPGEFALFHSEDCGPWTSYIALVRGPLEKRVRASLD